MNIGLIGSGGREHSLCKKISESNLVKKIFCFPGNAGTAKIAKNIDVNILDFKKILKLIKFNKIDLVVVVLIISRTIRVKMTRITRMMMMEAEKSRVCGELHLPATIRYSRHCSTAQLSQTQ